MIDEISKIVENVCASENNAFGYGIWTHHITKVVETCKRLAPMFNADEEIVVLGALLHDYAGIKDYKLHKDHHIHGATEAEKILKQFNYPQDRIDLVKTTITEHRGSVRMEKSTPEAECLANADAMTHIEQVHSLVHYVYVTREMSIDEGAKWIHSKLRRTWGKMSPEVQELVKDKYEAAIKTFQ